MPTNTTELLIWNAFRKDDKEAFRQLYSLYAKSLLLYGRRVTQDDQLIEDCVHDLFVELWQSRKKLSDTDSVKFYLFKSLRNKINYNITRNARFELSDFSEPYHPIDDFQIERQLIDQDEKQQLIDQLRKGFEQLTPRQREAISLSYYQHFSNEEVSQIMGVNYQSACRFIYSALKTLRKVVQILSMIWISCIY